MSSSVIPSFRYDDAPGIIDFLCDAFGFERNLVVPDGDGGVAHAQLTLGGGMIMLGSAREDDFGALVVTAKAAGAITGSAYVVVADVDAHCARARAAGAEIVMEPADQDYGGRLYAARDPEGQLWNFGSYDPWAGHD